MTSPSQSPTATPRKRRARGSISAEEILQGAFEITAEESLDGLSMPRLAQKLGVGVTSIYWYFRSKDELLDSMTEQAMVRFYEELHVPDGLPWDEHLRAFFTEFRRVFQEDDLLCDVIIRRTGNFTPIALKAASERIEVVLEALVDAGFSAESALYAYSCLSVYTRGALFIERGYALSGRPTIRPDEAREGLPVLDGLRGRHTLAMTDPDDFEFGVENILRGLRVLLADEQAAGTGGNLSDLPAGALRLR
jgi:AcrR family transcriptional regulator